jgi:uncharacterized membrane protein YcaP (DUF421 family)
MKFIPDDWAPVFTSELAFLELFVRGSLLYFVILVIMRVIPRRTGGELATMDLIFLLLVSQAAAQSMGKFQSVPDGIILIATFVGWELVFNAVSYHSPVFERLISAPSIQVVRDGTLLRRNMRREYLTEEELMSYLRRQGIEDLEDVKSVFVEGEGRLSVICHKDGRQQS